MEKLRSLGSLFVLLLFWGIPAPCQVATGPAFDPTPLQIPTAAKVPLRAVKSMDLLNIRDLHGLSISPDGKYLAFVVGQAVYETNAYRSGLFVMGTELGSYPVCLGSAGLPQWDDINQWVEEAPQWSSDSRYIMRRMRRAAAEKWQVWRWARDGSQRTQVTHVHRDVLSYNLAADGSKILLTAEKPRDPTEPERLAGDGILYDGSFFVTRNRSVVNEVSHTKPSETDSWIHEISTGKERKANQEEIKLFGPWVSDLDEKVLNKLSPSLEGHHIIDAKVSPDRLMVAYRYLPKDPAESQGRVYLLFVKPVRGGAPVQVQLPPDAYFVPDYWWSPDSNKLYYIQVEADGRSAKLMRIPIGGGPASQIFSSHNYLSSWSLDRRMRYMVCGQESATVPKQIALVDIERGSVRDLIDLNPEFQSIRLVAPIRIDGINRFGDAWFAHLVRPLNYEPGKRYPTILTTYRSGDYFLRGASGDENPIQVYAAHGFAVLSLDMGQDRYARIRPSEFQDFLLAECSPVASMGMAIQKGVEMGIVDPEKVGVTGYSRGTEQVAYAITHTNLFQAASGAAGDNGPFFYYMAPGNVQKLFARWGLGGWPEGDVNSKWKEIAADLNADRINVPVLNNDPDSEVIGDLSLYTSLKELGKPIELYIYPNELHHVNQPKHRYQIYERNLDWFRFWLKSEESNDPKKKEQYDRWHDLRRLQQRTDASRRPSPREKANQ